jgi:hypothetical protein
VRARGRLDLDLAGGGREVARQFGERRGYILRGKESGNAVRLVAMREVPPEWHGDVFEFVGRDVEVTGLFRSDPGSIAGAADLSGGGSSLEFWSFLGARQDEDETRKAPEVSVEDLVRDAEGREGQTIRVPGQFRGRNLYGDLPGDKGCSRSDWVIRTDGFAVWVTGKKPSGPGWKLDPASRGDTDKWVLVVGRPETRGGITCLRAIEVHLTSAPVEVRSR